MLFFALQYDWLVRERIADGPLIAKWRKPGYECLCSLLAVQKGNHNFGTTSHCRVPLKQRAAQQRMTPDVQTGCISCASCVIPAWLIADWSAHTAACRACVNKLHTVLPVCGMFAFAWRTEIRADTTHRAVRLCFSCQSACCRLARVDSPALSTGDARFGGPIWWNTPMREDDADAAEDEHRTQWELDGGDGGGGGVYDGGAGPSGQGGPPGGSKRDRVAAEEEAELPEDVQARLKALRGD
jgi:hypothetical protein